MTPLFTAAACLCLLGLVIRTSYEVLKKMKKVDTHNKIIFYVVLLGMCLLLLTWPVLIFTDPIRMDSPMILKLIGLTIVTLGVGLALVSLIQLKGVENIDHLVETGLFARIRHPMYTGFMLWILGWVLAGGSVVSAVIGILCIGNILYWRSLEEAHLAIQFGERYYQYRKSTWF